MLVSNVLQTQPLRTLRHRLRADSLLRNSMYIMGTTIITSLLGYVYWIIATRAYSAHDVGLIAALISAMTLTSSLSNLGIGSALIQVLPKRTAGHSWSLTLNAGLVIGSLAGVCAGLVITAALPLLSPQFTFLRHSAAFTIALVAGVPLWTIATLLDQTFVAERASRHMLSRNTLFSILKIVLLVLPVVVTRPGPLGIFASWVIAAAAAASIGLLFLVPRLGRDYRLTSRGLYAQVRSLSSSFVGHHLINVGGMAPMYLLPLFVTVRLTPVDNAYFYTTWMLGSLFFMISPAVSSALFAEGAHAATNMSRKVRSSALIICALLGPIILVFLLGGRFIIAVFGPGYPRHGLLVLTILTIAAVPDAITNIYVSMLRVQGRLRTAALLNLGMATVCLLLAWFLLPTQGIAGAGWAWLSGQLVGSAVVGIHVLVWLHKRREMATDVVDTDVVDTDVVDTDVRDSVRDCLAAEGTASVSANPLTQDRVEGERVA